MPAIQLSAVEELQLLRSLKAKFPPGGDFKASDVGNILQERFKINASDYEVKELVSRMEKVGMISKGEVAASDDKDKRQRTDPMYGLSEEYGKLTERFEGKFILNRRHLSDGMPSSTSSKVNASEVAIALRKKIMSLYGMSLRADGSGVDYDGAAGSEEFVQYGLLAEQLQFVDVSQLERDIPDEQERKALFFNLYNALVIHGHIALGNPANIPERGVFFTKTAYDVGGELWTLDVIEHGFLRCNRKKPFATAPLLDEQTDPRVRHKLTEPVDPRLHFALNCGAKSCPPIRFYSAEKLDSQLDLASRGFFRDDANMLLMPSTRSVKLTKLLDWYGFDFGEGHRAVLERILPFVEGEKHSVLMEMLSSPDDIQVDFYAYDWTENRADGT